MLQQQAQQDFPDLEKGWDSSARLLGNYLTYAFGVRAAMVIVMSAVGFILMIACANIAGLLLARASARKKEMAIRIALGAGRLRVIRQLLTEGLIIALAGGAMGLAMSFWGVDFLRANINFNDAVSAVSYRVDANVVIYTVLISIVSALLCSLAPAWQATKTDVNASLKDESRNASSGRSRLRSVLVTGEIALALFLLSGTGFLIFSIVQMLHQNPGFTAEQILTANVGLDDAHYHEPAKQFAFFRDVVNRLEKLPGVESAAATSDLPCSGAGQVAFRIQGEPEPPGNVKPTTHDYVITTGYFRAARIPLLRGREFTDADNDKAPRVVLVDTAFAQRFLKNTDPLGKVIGLEVGNSAEPEWAQIVGVVGNVKNWMESERKDPFVYEADAQRPQSNMSLMVRTTGSPEALGAGAAPRRLGRRFGSAGRAGDDDAGRAEARKRRRRSLQQDAGVVCAGRLDSFGDWDLRHRRVFRGAADARDRDSHRAWRRTARRRAHGAWRRNEARADRRRNWIRRITDAAEGARSLARRFSHTCDVDLCGCAGGDCRGRDSGDVHSCAACDARRSNGRAAVRIILHASNPQFCLM